MLKTDLFTLNKSLKIAVRITITKLQGLNNVRQIILIVQAGPLVI